MAGLHVVGVRPEMGGGSLHLLSDGRFSIREWPRPRRRAERFEVIEPGAGPRGLARSRGRAPTLESALELAAQLRPSTPAEILAPIRDAADATERDRERVDRLVGLSTPGTRLWVLQRYGESGLGYAATSEGLHCDYVLSFCDASPVGCWSIRWRADNGREDHGLHVVLLEDARRAWWIVRDGHSVAGGPPIYDAARAAELAAEFGGQAQLGLGADDPAAEPSPAGRSSALPAEDGSPAGQPDAGVVDRATAAAPAAVARHESPAGSGPTCACGCGRPVPVPRSGPPRRYATAACRAAVYRRRRADVPLDLPRQPNDHGRRRLAATQRT
jgi:hypothetical protein